MITVSMVAVTLSTGGGEGGGGEEGRGGERRGEEGIGGERREEEGKKKRKVKKCLAYFPLFPLPPFLLLSLSHILMD